MRFELLNTDDFFEKYNAAFADVSDLSNEELKADFETLDKEIKERLKVNGLSEGDVCISDEWQEGFHHCGGMYTKKAHTNKTLEIIFESISKTKYSTRWYFHMACEASEEFEGAEYMAQFYIHNGMIYFDNEDSSLHQLLLGG